MAGTGQSHLADFKEVEGQTMQPSNVTFLFLGLLVGGVGFVGWGASLTNSWLSILLASFGSALFGTSISGLIGSLDQRGFYGSMKSLVEASANPSLTSTPSAVAPHQRRYYRYSVTQMSGQWLWRHAVADFSQSSPGQLVGIAEYPDKQGKLKRYRTEAALRGDSLIMLSSAETGNEATAVQIYPMFAKEFHGVQCGFSFVETWDGGRALTPCLISESPIDGWTRRGSVSDEIGKKCEELWKSGTSALTLHLPQDALPDA